jgi:hypothetical protein
VLLLLLLMMMMLLLLLMLASLVIRGVVIPRRQLLKVRLRRLWRERRQRCCRRGWRHAWRAGHVVSR